MSLSNLYCMQVLSLAWDFVIKRKIIKLSSDLCPGINSGNYTIYCSLDSQLAVELVQHLIPVHYCIVFL